MKINFLDLNEDRPYYEVEIWQGGDAESEYFDTLKEARANLKKRTKGNPADCIKHHKGEAGFWACEITE